MPLGLTKEARGHKEGDRDGANDERVDQVERRKRHVECAGGEQGDGRGREKRGADEQQLVRHVEQRHVFVHLDDILPVACENKRGLNIHFRSDNES
ncbi:hypothetical protein DPMN_128675 [Dreissena polymorpha]|uniref:Uncharacterized protein n=1 Tax=Dreissena polymorpha TaxID=45954 RepID=A0A9D4H1B2_DREPO|nr:hypothetical protein DPMN_128675 [Dreissena polymorpha]